MESAEGVAAKPGDNRSGDTPPKWGTDALELGGRHMLGLGAAASCTLPPRPGRAHLGATCLHPHSALAVSRVCCTGAPRPWRAKEDGERRRRPARRGAGRPRLLLRRRSAGGVGTASWAAGRGGRGRGQVHFPARPSSSDHPATLCSDFQLPPPPRPCLTQPALPFRTLPFTLTTCHGRGASQEESRWHSHLERQNSMAPIPVT
ncbi:hypothetical protein mRhiFer1_010104 [Rhinolophus ferrumequinum]|uniref:Uncharacterized protein n=1 Tax=Rhinolophus ferrumequinum TaxID=59479 RepID=A0A7J7XQD8_RHIFE|nr:hypothetical protein mRhiFer1_010104 [Rhinolophus ferrumequinum]